MSLLLKDNAIYKQEPFNKTLISTLLIFPIPYKNKQCIEGNSSP